jgi:hypothetical protein
LDADEEVEPELLAEILLFFGGSGDSRSERIKHLEQTRYVFTKQTRRDIDRIAAGANSESVFVALTGILIPRKNYFLAKWIRHGGFWPDPKMRLFRKGAARFEDRAVHEDAKLESGVSGRLKNALLHHSYPTLSDYIEHMNRYSSLGADMAVEQGYRGFSFVNIVLRPWATFVYNYVFRLGFLDGREGLLLHLYHAVYVSWKYAKAWELSRKSN